MNMTDNYITEISFILGAFSTQQFFSTWSVWSFDL